MSSYRNPNRLIVPKHYENWTGHINWSVVDFVPVSTMEVEAVVGRTGSLPCDIEPDSHEDRVYMVLWFRHAGGKPLYRLDFFSYNLPWRCWHHKYLNRKSFGVVATGWLIWLFNCYNSFTNLEQKSIISVTKI